MIPNRRLAAVFAAVLLVLSIPAGMAGASVTSTDSTTEIDADHGLADAGAISEYRDSDSVTGDIPQLQASLTFADEKSDVDRADSLLPTDTRNKFLRIQYEEDVERTLRIRIPREYATPYTREEVDAVGSDHTASFEPVRNGEYLQVLVHVDGPTDVVLPVERDSSLTYDVLETANDRIETTTGYSPMGEPGEWTYVDDEELATEAGVPIENASAGDVVVQYDGTPDSPEETWLNAPEGDNGDSSIYYYVKESENNTVYLVSTTDDPPEVRYKDRGSRGDLLSGWINDAEEIPGRWVEDPIGELFGGLFGGESGDSQ